MWDALETQSDKIYMAALASLMTPSVYSNVVAKQVTDVVTLRDTIQQTLKKLGVEVEHVRDPLKMTKKVTKAFLGERRDPKDHPSKDE